MKLHHFLPLLLLVLSVSACSNNGDTQPAQANDTATTINASTENAPSAEECYTRTTAGDTVNLSLVVSGSTVTGTFYTNYSGKDRNQGTITGEMKGDTLFAQYNFQSEGVASVREVAFLKQGNIMLEGYGPVNQINGVMKFSKPDALTFNSANKLEKITCSVD